MGALASVEFTLIALIELFNLWVTVVFHNVSVLIFLPKHPSHQLGEENKGDDDCESTEDFGSGGLHRD